jgi:GNAT superfamily N-acetyltransferase
VDIRIRPINPRDVRWMVPAFLRMSPDTIYQRFFTHMKELPPDLAYRFTHVDHSHRQALVAEICVGISYKPAGVARYEPAETEGMAEVAILVTDEFQNHGIGHQLFHAILKEGVEHGIHTFCADVLSENRRMLHLLENESNILSSKVERGVTHLVFTPHENTSH